MDFCYGSGKIGHLLKDCNNKTSDEDEDCSNLSFGSWMRASPTRSRQSGGGEFSRLRSHQKMIFKPEIWNGRDMQNYQVGRDGGTVDMRQGINAVIGMRDVDKDVDDLIIMDPETPLKDVGLSKKQTEELATMLNSISGWHISPTRQERRAEAGVSNVNLKEVSNESSPLIFNSLQDEGQDKGENALSK